ncbi:MAG TPA: hypothetical protein PJ994_05740 [Tepidiformaceae bacterium]|nr:hypothetical protein [Tepidiformaceae bacterium]
MDRKALIAFITAAAVSAGLVGGSIAAWANSNERQEEKTRQSTGTAPEDQVPTAPPVNRTDLPLRHGPFQLVPPEFERRVHYNYGDDRDTWTWRSGTASNFEDLPPDPQVARLPAMPDGYTLSEIGYTVGTSQSGHATELSELHLSFQSNESPGVTVHIWRPVELVIGEPFVVVVPEDSDREALSLVDIAGRPAVYSYQHISALEGGVQILIVADGEIMVAVESYRGTAFTVFHNIAASILR